MPSCTEATASVCASRGSQLCEEGRCSEVRGNDLIDFPCSAGWTEFYAHKGMTIPLASGYPHPRRKLPDIAALELRTYPDLRQRAKTTRAIAIRPMPPMIVTVVPQAPRLKGGFDVDAASN